MGYQRRVHGYNNDHWYRARIIETFQNAKNHECIKFRYLMEVNGKIEAFKKIKNRYSKSIRPVSIKKKVSNNRKKARSLNALNSKIMNGVQPKKKRRLINRDRPFDCKVKGCN